MDFALESFIGYCDNQYEVANEGFLQSLKATVKRILLKVIHTLKGWLSKGKDNKLKQMIRSLLDRAEKALTKNDRASSEEEVQEVKKEADQINEEAENLKSEMEAKKKPSRRGADFDEWAETPTGKATLGINQACNEIHSTKRFIANYDPSTATPDVKKRYNDELKRIKDAIKRIESYKKDLKAAGVDSKEIEEIVAHSRKQYGLNEKYEFLDEEVKRQEKNASASKWASYKAPKLSKTDQVAKDHGYKLIHNATVNGVPSFKLIPIEMSEEDALAQNKVIFNKGKSVKDLYKQLGWI